MVLTDARFLHLLHLVVPFIVYCTRVVYNFQYPMPLAKASVPHKRKRQRSRVDSEADVSPQPTVKRQKLEHHQRYRTPSSFWDNLSRQWLTRRALREFDRRTVWPATPVPPHRTGKENIDVAKVKRFARQGGPNLGDIRGVSTIQIPLR